MSKLTHLNAAGEAHMVDVGPKVPTKRIAIASGAITMKAETLALIETGEHQKGDVLGTARVAGIMAAKKTADLIPLCHPIELSKVEVACSRHRVPSHRRVGRSHRGRDGGVNSSTDGFTHRIRHV